MSGKAVFGKPRDISGVVVADKATLVPLKMLRDLRPRSPYPITISGANQVIFSANASVTNKMTIWIGDDLVHLDEALAYTWTASTTNTILNSAGVVTASQAPALGMWYYYIGIDATNKTLLLYPSQTPPSQVEAPYENGHFAHPGLSRARSYSYVGMHLCTATTPVFKAMTKLGYKYNFAALSEATATTWAELDFSGADALPKHGALGVEVGGHVNAGAAGTIVVGSLSTNTLGVYKAGDPTSTGDNFSPLPGVTPTSNGKVYAQHTTAAGDVNITWIKDVV